MLLRTQIEAAAIRTARVEYPTGREFLSAYWGYLSSGGLLLDAQPDVPAGLSDGDAIILDVRIASLRKEYRLAGRLRRRSDGRTLVAFNEGEPQDVLLNAAWADGQGVPERRHRRLPMSVAVRFHSGDGEGEGLVVNVSRGGLCLEADARLRNGIIVSLSGVTAAGDGIVADGRVRWSGRLPRRHYGIEFSRYRDDLVRRVEQFESHPL